MTEPRPGRAVNADVVWEPPGAGEWEYDGSHSPPAPTPVFREVASRSMDEAYRWVFETYGAPLDTIAFRFVNGKAYRRLVPLVGADRSGPPPPAPVLWLAARLHPGLRRRERAARANFERSLFLEPIDRWDGGERQEWIDANRAFQAEAIDELDDEAMADHLARVLDHNLRGWIRHHQLHGTDMGPIGDLLAHTNRWGLDPVSVMELLRGRSPATVEAAERALAIAEAVRAAGLDPTTLTDLDQVRSASDEAAALLADYLEHFGWRLVSSYDIEGLTVGELPGGTLAMIRTAAPIAEDRPSEEPLRAAVPTSQRGHFDALLENARRAYGLRDDNGPLTAEWPMGLVRRAFLETGRRLAERGRLTDPANVFELTGEEAVAVLGGAAEPSATAAVPSATDLEVRAADRAAQTDLVPPDRLGPAFDPPPPDALPPGMRRLVEAVNAVVSMLEPEPEPEGGQALHGLGIGDRTVSGRARVATRPEDVLTSIEEGDILVAAWTAPTYNAVLAAVSGVVVQEGGLLCHAAVMARELGIPAVVGAAEAMTAIADGDDIEVDPVAGTVRVLTSSP